MVRLSIDRKSVIFDFSMSQPSETPDTALELDLQRCGQLHISHSDFVRTVMLTLPYWSNDIKHDLLLKLMPSTRLEQESDDPRSGETVSMRLSGDSTIHIRGGQTTVTEKIGSFIIHAVVALTENNRLNIGLLKRHECDEFLHRWRACCARIKAGSSVHAFTI